MLFLIAVGAAGALRGEDAKLVLANDGRPQVSIVAGSVRAPADELKTYLDRITGGAFPIVTGRPESPAIYVGLASDFPWHEIETPAKLGDEGFVIQVAGGNLLVVGQQPLGVQHGVTTLLHELGCRWFFPGDVWEVIPQQKNLAVSLDVRSTPSFPTQRRIWYGFGAYGPGKEDWDAWMRHNRMGGPLTVGIGHSWAGLNPQKDFEQHPEWFALVDGKRQPSKPCYTHPDVLAKAKQAALARAEQGDAMISMTPPDGLGYCSCQRCKAVAGVTEVFDDKGSLFGKQSDGALVNVTSQTVFHFANEVAEAVAAKYPRTLIGCYAYSAYSHPPTFKLHPNVYLQTTTAFRRTPLSLEEQVSAFGEKTEQLGIREYYSVYQWDWDYPDPGKMTPDVLKQDLSDFHAWGVTAVNAEASNNWGARGLGYYVASQLMWDVDADTRPMVKDFYERAFGPAAPAMERYFVRWHGAGAAALSDAEDLPQRAKYFEKGKHDVDVLRAAYSDLDDAIKLAGDNEAVLTRIDHLRMYLHYLLLRWRLEQAESTGDDEQILAAIGAETQFGARLTYTNMIHTRPLLGKAFLRRFRTHADLLEKLPASDQRTAEWRVVGAPPAREELHRLWTADKQLLGI